MTSINIRLCIALTILPFFTINIAVSQEESGRDAFKQEMKTRGEEHATAWDLYQALKEEADGGHQLAWDKMPDWSGIYSRPMIHGIFFDPDQLPGELPSAKLTPVFHQKLLAKIERTRMGKQYDVISDCRPPGHPRWLTEPFLREFIITPGQTWLINEMVNDVRRVYTDGRAHTAEEDKYPLYNGDSIGFWDGDKLVIHTNQLMEGQYNRMQPDYTDQVETVEIWHKAANRTLVADVWVYDPPSLLEPWYVRHTYAKLSNDDTQLRIRYWHCGENQNNKVIETDEGATQFQDLTFTDEDDIKVGTE